MEACWCEWNTRRKKNKKVCTTPSMKRFVKPRCESFKLLLIIGLLGREQDLYLNYSPVKNSSRKKHTWCSVCVTCACMNARQALIVLKSGMHSTIIQWKRRPKKDRKNRRGLISLCQTSYCPSDGHDWDATLWDAVRGLEKKTVCADQNFCKSKMWTG